MMSNAIRRFAGELISEFLLRSGSISSVIKKVRNGEMILPIYFHNPKKKAFLSVIQWLEEEGLSFISSDELLQIIENKTSFPKGAVAVSVDDGWHDNIKNIFDTEKGNDIPITLFATIQPILEDGVFWWSYADMGISKGLRIMDKKKLKKVQNQERLNEIEHIRNIYPMSRESIDLRELRQLSKRNNITIGCHTHGHPILTSCDPIELEFEILEAKMILEKLIGKSIRYFAYPNGMYKEREINSVRNAGYSGAFGTQPAYITNEMTMNRFDIPRFEISDDVGLKENICRATGVWYALNLSKEDNA